MNIRLGKWGAFFAGLSFFSQVCPAWFCMEYCVDSIPRAAGWLISALQLGRITAGVLYSVIIAVPGISFISMSQFIPPRIWASLLLQVKQCALFAIVSWPVFGIVLGWRNEVFDDDHIQVGNGTFKTVTPPATCIHTRGPGSAALKLFAKA